MPMCTTCGGTIARADENCSYCGADNPEYSPISSDLDALMQGALGALQTGSYAAAVKLYQQVITTDPEIVMAYFYLGYCLNQLRQYDEAIAAMKQAIERRSGSASLHYNVGVIAQSLGRDAEARTYLQQALKLVDSDPHIEDRADMRARVEEALRKSP